ncbi:T9SS type A sorting domain-containing protein [Calditrichota bacterium]
MGDGPVSIDIYDLSINGISENNSDVPHQLKLYQNYPNPFNPLTNIQFSIDKSEFVTLKILNLLGQEVASLVSEKLTPGKYTYFWDATGFASGLYYCKLQRTKFHEIKRMILLK